MILIYENCVIMARELPKTLNLFFIYNKIFYKAPVLSTKLEPFIMLIASSLLMCQN